MFVGGGLHILYAWGKNIVTLFMNKVLGMKVLRFKKKKYIVATVPSAISQRAESITKVIENKIFIIKQRKGPIERNTC